MIRLGERQRNVIYLPHYYALAGGFYQRADLPVQLMAMDVDDGPTALAEGRLDIVLGGPMRTMRSFEEDGIGLKSFATIVQRHPWVLLARAPQAFDWADLTGRQVIDFAEAPTPRVALRTVVQRAGIDPDSVLLRSDLRADQGVEAFRGGVGDYLLHSLHTAEPLLLAGEAVVVASLADALGRIPFATMSAAPRWLDERLAEVHRVATALDQAIAALTADLRDGAFEPVSELVGPFFAGMDRPVLASAIRRYHDLDIWPSDARCHEADFESFRRILREAGWIAGAAGFHDVTLTWPDTGRSDLDGAADGRT